MCIWNKILVGLISVASLVLFYMAARALQDRNLLEFELAAEAPAENQAVGKGKPRFGRRDRAAAGHSADSAWICTSCCWIAAECGGSAIRGSSPARTDATAEVTVALDPDRSAHGIAKGNCPLCFRGSRRAEQRAEPRAIRGRVHRDANAGDKQLTLDPTSRSKPPRDGQVDEDETSVDACTRFCRTTTTRFSPRSATSRRKRCCRPTVVQEYLKDGKPAAKGDPAGRVVNGNYRAALGRLRRCSYRRAGSTASFWPMRSKPFRRISSLSRRRWSRRRDQEEACKRDIAATDRGVEEDGARARRGGGPSRRSCRRALRTCRRGLPDWPKRTGPWPAKSPSTSWRPRGALTNAPVSWHSPARGGDKASGYLRPRLLPPARAAGVLSASAPHRRRNADRHQRRRLAGRCFYRPRGSFTVQSSAAG